MDNCIQWRSQLGGGGTYSYIRVCEHEYMNMSPSLIESGYVSAFFNEFSLWGVGGGGGGGGKIGKKGRT